MLALKVLLIVVESDEEGKFHHRMRTECCPCQLSNLDGSDGPEQPRSESEDQLLQRISVEISKIVVRECGIPPDTFTEGHTTNYSGKARILSDDIIRNITEGDDEKEKS